MTKAYMDIIQASQNNEKPRNCNKYRKTMMCSYCHYNIYSCG